MSRRLIILVVVLIGALALTISACSPVDLEEQCTEHVWENEIVMGGASCTKPGKALQRCSVCGKSQQVDIEPLGHDLVVKDNSGISATCEGEGFTGKLGCSRCDYQEEGTVIPALGHSWDEGKVTTAPTCEGTGVKTYTCLNDGSHTKTEEVSAVGHAYGEWEVVTPATCTSEGEEKQVCANDATHFATRPISKLNHNHNIKSYQIIDGVLKLVRECACGTSQVLDDVDNTATIAVSNASDLEAVLNGGGYAVILEDNITLDNGVITITKDATLYLNGKTITSNVAKITESVVGNKSVCDVFLVQGDVTFNINGDGKLLATHGEAETVCVLSAIDGATINIYGGEYVSSGCTTIFARTNSVINVFDGKFVAEDNSYGYLYTLDIWEDEDKEIWAEINVYGGEYVAFNPANHQGDGTYTNKLVEGVHSLLVEGAYIVSDHEYDDGVVTAPTCTEQGYTTYTCVCNHSYKDNYEDALDHDMVEADCENNAYCKREGCGYVVEGSALGHKLSVDNICSVCGIQQSTVSVKIADYATANNWANSIKYETVNIDNNITATAKGGGNTGKYYTSGNEWRIYQSETPTITLTAKNGATLLSIKITYKISNSGVLVFNSNNITSATTINVSGTSVQFGVGNTGTATNGQVKITAIEVVYTYKACAHENTKEKEEVAPTCIEAGITAGTWCNDCGNYISGGEEIPATGEHVDNNSDNKCDTCDKDMGSQEPETNFETTTYTFSSYAAGTQYAKKEEHVLDDNTTMYTTECHFTSELRIYSSSTHNGYAIIESKAAIKTIGINAGKESDTIVVYVSEDGIDYKKAGTIAVTSSYKDYTLDLGGAYKYIKLDVEGSNQVRLKSITLNPVM